MKELGLVISLTENDSFDADMESSFQGGPVYQPVSEPEPEVQFVRLPFLQGCLGSTLTHSGVCFWKHFHNFVQ
jgi:hypothetical protein